MSGRASAPEEANIPAPMVAASATAILNDINISNISSFAPAHPFGGREIPPQTLQNAGFPPAFCRRIFDLSR